MPLIKDRRIVDDPWAVAAADAPLPDAAALLVPLAVWQAQRDTLLRRNGRLGVLLTSDQPPELIAGDLDRLDLVALDFPTFRDGRAYSYARLLRERYGYRKELRAVGNVLRDQYLFLHRCGFDAFDVKDEKAAETLSNALAEISVFYQPAADRRPAVAALRRAMRPWTASGPGRFRILNSEAAAQSNSVC